MPLSRTSHAGWVQRRTTIHDALGSVALLTAKDTNQVERLAPLHVEKVRQLIFDAVDMEQKCQLDKICSAVLATDEGGNLVV